MRTERFMYVLRSSAVRSVGFFVAKLSLLRTRDWLPACLLLLFPR